MDRRESMVKKWVKALKWMMAGGRSENDKMDFESLTVHFDRTVAGWPEAEAAVRFAMLESGIPSRVEA